MSRIISYKLLAGGCCFKGWVFLYTVKEILQEKRLMNKFFYNVRSEIFYFLLFQRQTTHLISFKHGQRCLLKNFWVCHSILLPFFCKCASFCPIYSLNTNKLILIHLTAYFCLFFDKKLFNTNIFIKYFVYNILPFCFYFLSYIKNLNSMCIFY